jgi:hypothetical protein
MAPLGKRLTPVHARRDGDRRPDPSRFAAVPPNDSIRKYENLLNEDRAEHGAAKLNPAMQTSER